MRQQHTICDFSTSDSWVVLSPIEQSIKRKLEVVGTPLKNWDIHIFRGVLTGCNEAFIINTNTRNEILSNCKDADERKRTEELIRPILRGRDIKRYGYEWAGLYLIATFPSRHYDIEQYPAVKKYLLSYADSYLRSSKCDDIANTHLAEFCLQKLAQTGKVVVIDGTEVTISGKKEKARKKTSNKWFETQDSINYWDYFSKPKIMWKRIGSILRFCYNDNGALGLDSTCFATGNNIEYICCVLNSSMGHYLLKDSPKTGTGDLLISVQAIDPIRVPHISAILSDKFKTLLKEFCNTRSKALDDEINNEILSLYKLNSEECEYITKNFI